MQTHVLIKAGIRYTARRIPTTNVFYLIPPFLPARVLWYSTVYCISCGFRALGSGNSRPSIAEVDCRLSPRHPGPLLST